MIDFSQMMFNPQFFHTDAIFACWLATDSHSFHSHTHTHFLATKLLELHISWCTTSYCFDFTFRYKSFRIAIIKSIPLTGLYWMKIKSTLSMHIFRVKIEIHIHFYDLENLNKWNFILNFHDFQSFWSLSMNHCITPNTHNPNIIIVSNLRWDILRNCFSLISFRFPFIWITEATWTEIHFIQSIKNRRTINIHKSHLLQACRVIEHPAHLASLYSLVITKLMDINKIMHFLPFKKLCVCVNNLPSNADVFHCYIFVHFKNYRWVKW